MATAIMRAPCRHTTLTATATARDARPGSSDSRGSAPLVVPGGPDQVHLCHHCYDVTASAPAAELPLVGGKEEEESVQSKIFKR